MMKQSQMLHKVQVTPSYSGKEYLKLLDKVQSIFVYASIGIFLKKIVKNEPTIVKGIVAINPFSNRCHMALQNQIYSQSALT